jgi:hypothetical protein
MLGPITTPLRTLLFASGGAGLAWLWYHWGHWQTALIVVLVWAVLVVVQYVAVQRITTKPMLALRLFELRLLGIAIVSAATAAAVIVVTVSLAAPEGADTATKEMITAATAALTAFISGIAVAAKDADESIGDLVEEQFQSKFVRAPDPAGAGQTQLPAGSDAEKAVFTSYEYGWTDWSKKVRLERVTELDKYLSTKS